MPTEASEAHRLWRLKSGDPGHKAYNRAAHRALQFLRAEDEELWQLLLTEARLELGLIVERAPAGAFAKATIVHGTTGGYKMEWRRGLTPCDECKAAMARRSREQYAKLKDRIRSHIVEIS